MIDFLVQADKTTQTLLEIKALIGCGTHQTAVRSLFS